MKKQFILDAICVLFAVLFVYAAATKLLEYELFKAQIGKSPLILNHSQWLAWAVPSVELGISILLFLPRFQLFALYGSFFLMFLFTAYIGFLLTFSPYVPCSCGGVLSSLGWTEHLFFNIGFTLLAVIGIVLFDKSKQNKNQNSPHPLESL